MSKGQVKNKHKDKRCCGLNKGTGPKSIAQRQADSRRKGKKLGKRRK